MSRLSKTFDTLHRNFTHNGIKHAEVWKVHGKLGETDWGVSETGTPLTLYVGNNGRIKSAYKCPERCLKDLLGRVMRSETLHP